MISLPNPTSKMTMNESDLYTLKENYHEDCEHDDYMTAEDYDRKEYYRNGWDAERYDSQRW